MKTGGRVSYELVDPTSKSELSDEIMTHGFRLAVDLYSAKQFWCYLLVESGERAIQFFPRVSRLRVICEPFWKQASDA